MAAVDAAGSAVVDVADAETYLGDDASDHGHHAEHGQADEPEAAATQQVNEDLEEEAQFVLLTRLLGPGKELAAQEVKVPYIIGESGSGNTVIVGRSAEVNIIDEKRASEKQLISREHARFVSKQSGMYISNMCATGTLVNDRLLDNDEEVLIKHGHIITFGRDCTAPGQMLPYDGMKLRVVFPRWSQHHRPGSTPQEAERWHRGLQLQADGAILPQILGSLPEVIRSCCHHHHHHHHHTRSSRGRFEWSARFHRPSRRVAGPGKRHSARGTPRAQPRDVRSAGRDTWNLTGEALGGPRKRSWRRCSRARSGRRSAIRGAHSGAFDRP